MNLIYAYITKSCQLIKIFVKINQDLLNIAYIFKRKKEKEIPH